MWNGLSLLFTLVLLSLLPSTSAAGDRVTLATPQHRQALKSVGLKADTRHVGVVLVADMMIWNHSPWSIKDPTVTCTHMGPSGTVIETNTRTIYEEIPAQHTRQLRDVNMGFIHPQTSRSICQITDLVVLP